MSATATPADAGTRLEAAATELSLERRRVGDELEALRAFEHRLRGVDPDPVPDGGPRPVGVVDDAAGEALAAVREAYRETVMSVPHYEAEYDDTYAESLREEFSPQLAAALTSARRFEASHRRALLSAVGTSKSSREAFLTTLEAERAALESATETLTSVDENLADLASAPLAELTFGALDAYRTRLEVLRDKCERVLEERQRAVFEQRRTQWLPADAPDIAQYLYAPLADDYPVMAVVADLLEHIGELRRRVERAMSFCRA